MGYIDVTPVELIKSGQTLKAIADDLRSAHGRIEGLRPHQLGSRSIESALNHFADEWQYGLRKIVEKVDMTGEAILAAGEQYAGIDSAVARAARSTTG